MIPSLFMIFMPSGAAGNEILAPAPYFAADVLSQCGKWVNDHFAFRQEMITAWAYLNKALFRTSAEDQVVIGRDGWLYYAKDFGNELSDEDMESIASHLAEIQNEVTGNGAQFIFTIAPDKSGVYPQFLGSEAVHGKPGRKIEPYLEKYGINYINLYEMDIPYFKTDSHWTSFGAAKVCDALVGTGYSSESFDRAGTHRGDLYEMLFPAGKLEEDDPKCELSYQTKGFVNGGNAITIETTGSGTGTLYCWRDSFGVFLYPFLADAFENATFSRSIDYDVSSTGDADVVILEIVERNLSYLK